jgi:hypothetical protein
MAILDLPFSIFVRESARRFFARLASEVFLSRLQSEFFSILLERFSG